MRPLSESAFESTDLFVLKQLWKLSSVDNRQNLRAILNDQCQLPESRREPFAGPKEIWLRLSERDRQQWAAWVDQQPA